MSKQPTGLYDKFRITRRDKRDQIGGDRMNADYFVLDLTYDPFAKKALLAYALACAAEYPELSNQIMRKLDR